MCRDVPEFANRSDSCKHRAPEMAVCLLSLRLVCQAGMRCAGSQLELTCGAMRFAKASHKFTSQIPFPWLVVRIPSRSTHTCAEALHAQSKLCVRRRHYRNIQKALSCQHKTVSYLTRRASRLPSCSGLASAESDHAMLETCLMAVQPVAVVADPNSLVLFAGVMPFHMTVKLGSANEQFDSSLQHHAISWFLVKFSESGPLAKPGEVLMIGIQITYHGFRTIAFACHSDHNTHQPNDQNANELSATSSETGSLSPLHSLASSGLCC
jgi:hypothetical protein